MTFYTAMLIKKVLAIKSQILCAEKMYGRFDKFEVRHIKMTICK